MLVIIATFGGFQMRLARHSAILLAFIAIAVSGPTQFEFATGSLAVNESGMWTSSIETERPPFRCDSARARDCFEMFKRHNQVTTVRMAAVALPVTPDRLAPATLIRDESSGCLLDGGHRGDRCPLRSGR